MFLRRWPAALLAVALSLACAAVAFDLRVNWTESMPVGVYRVVAPRLDRGSIVAICLSSAAASVGRSRGYLVPGRCPGGASPVVEQIVAGPADDVRLTAEATLVNGRALGGSELQGVDSEGRQLAHHPLGRYVLGDGEYWVSGLHRRRSWDSRYFGPVQATDIVSSAVPLLTWTRLAAEEAE